MLLYLLQLLLPRSCRGKSAQGLSASSSVLRRRGAVGLCAVRAVRRVLRGGATRPSVSALLLHGLIGRTTLRPLVRGLRLRRV
eukprot:3434481-Pyramimonas_sp.AAC.1